MESTAEHDLLRLEEWLDGSASSEQVEALRRRVAVEPALAQALDRMKAERETRQQVWSWIEPSQADADHCADAALKLIRQGRVAPSRRAGWLAYARGAAAAAACAGFFLVGWATRGGSGGRSFPSAPIGVNDRFVGNASAPLASANRTPTRDKLFHVAVTDESGNVIAFQPFNEAGEARRFADDLARWQANRQQAQQGRLLRVADEF